MEIVVSISLREILNNYDFNRYCEISGLNPWCINEGLASGDEIVELTRDAAKYIGINI